jgi:hypothetical protein
MGERERGWRPILSQLIIGFGKSLTRVMKHLPKEEWKEFDRQHTFMDPNPAKTKFEKTSPLFTDHLIDKNDEKLNLPSCDAKRLPKPGIIVKLSSLDSDSYPNSAVDLHFCPLR